MKGSLILLITLFLFGCSKEASLFCENEISILKNNVAETVVLNLNSETLINDIESQTSTDLCKSSNLNGSILINEKNIKFKIKIAKPCNWYHKPTNRVNITLNKSNQILFTDRYDTYLVKNLNKRLNLATNEIIKTNKSPVVIYKLDWDNEINIDSLNNRFHQIFSVISKVSDSISIVKFNKTLCELKEPELNKIDGIFSGIIEIGSYSFLEPPLPPKKAMEYSEEIDSILSN